ALHRTLRGNASDRGIDERAAAVLPLSIVPREKGHLDRLQSEIQELIDDLWQVPRFSAMRRCFRPQFDAVRAQTPPTYRAAGELCGLHSESRRICADDRPLVVAGPRSPAWRGRFFQLEIEHGPFQRRIQFAEQVEPANAAATYERGLLSVTVPIAQREPARER